MPIVDITPKFIKTRLICPAGKRRIEYCDRSIKGLFIEVTEKSPGKGTYRLRHTVNGKNQYIQLGHTTDCELRSIKQRAREFKAQYALQKNPYQEIQDQKAVPTWSSFFEKQYMPYVKPRKRTYGKDETMYRLRLKKTFGDKRLNQVTRQDIISLHSDLVQKEELSPATADRYLSHIKAVLNHAVRLDVISNSTAKGISLFNVDNQMENYLNSDELKRLLKSLESDSNRVVVDLVFLLLNSGARLMEAQMAKWKHINFDQKIWLIPATNSKSKKVRSIPLNNMAIEVLERNISDNEYIFVNSRTGTAYNNIHKSWNRIRNRAGLPNFRLHDLRHNFSSILVSEAGRSLYELQKILGHASPIMTQRYAHLSTKTLQEASNCASDHIREAMKTVSDGN
jgi:integrase